MDEPPDRELADAVDELADALEALREELREPPREPPRGPFGLPRPPTPGELLRFTERYTIPTVIALLETSIRALELLSAAIRLADGRPLDGPDRPATGGRAAGLPGRADRLAAVSRRSLRALDDALGDLQTAVAEGSPDDPELRRLLEQARALREEVDDRLAAATSEAVADDRRSAGPEPDGPGEAGRSDDASASTPVDIDVEEEIETIKRDLDEATDSDDGQDIDDPDIGGQDIDDRPDVENGPDDEE